MKTAIYRGKTQNAAVIAPKNPFAPPKYSDSIHYDACISNGCMDVMMISDAKMRCITHYNHWMHDV